MTPNKHYIKEGRSANMRLASCGVKCLNSSSVFQINFSAGLTVLCPEIPHERQAQKRYVDDDIITKIPIVTEQGEHQNIHTREFKLINTTNKDIPQFRIIFEFDAQSKILKNDTYCKIGKNKVKDRILKPNEVSFLIKNFNRGDEFKFKFDIANINRDEYNITEAECTGFKILPIDKRKKHKKNHGKIVKKEQIN